MKKAKAPLKKMNKIKSKSKPTKIVGKMKSLAKGLVKAMSSKPAKKAQVKAAPKAAAKPVKAAPKDLKAAKKVAAPAKAPVNLKTTATKDLGKETKLPKGKEVENKPSSKSKNASPVVAAVLAKPAKEAKGGKGAKTRLTAAQLAEHLEKMCREPNCENMAMTKGYCRLDYIKNWKKIKRKEMILKEGKLNNYIEELVSKYPDKYIDVIRQDLSTEVNFNKVIHDLELDESIDDLDYDGDSIDSLIGSVRKDAEDFDDGEF